MAYERTNWQNGDVISSEKLNKMEAGLEYACSLEHEVEDPTEGQVLKYDAEKGKFVNEDVPAAIETNIQNPTDGQTLKYDAESGKWVNREGGSGGGTLVVTANNNTLDKTWQEIADAFPNVVLYEEFEGYGFDRVIPFSLSRSDSEYFVVFGETEYKTNSSNGYPGHSVG